MLDGAPSSPAAPRASFSTAPEPYSGNAHRSCSFAPGNDVCSVGAVIRPPEVRRELRSHASPSVGASTRVGPREKGSPAGDTL